MHSEKAETADLRELDTPKAVCVDDDGKKSADLAQLESKLETERDGRKEERFFWIFVLIIVLDMGAFQRLGIWQAILIFLLELPALILLANHLGVDIAVNLLNWLLRKFMDKLPNLRNE